jgi:hypothetical protein
MAIILTAPAAYNELELALERMSGPHGLVRMARVHTDGSRSKDREDKLELDLPRDEVEWALATVSSRSAVRPWVKRSGSEDRLDPMREIGQRLYSALFQGERARFLRRELEDARSRARTGLRIRLRTEDGEWASLPWEFLHDGQEFINLSPWSPLIRTLAGSALAVPRPLQPPVRVLAVSADPTGNLAAQAELDLLEEVAQHTAELQIRNLPQATREAFIQAISAEDFHVLHVIGGTRRFSDGQAALVLVRPDGLTIDNIDQADPEPWIDAGTLAQLLRSKPDLRLVHLSTCHTQALAVELASVVPAVIGILGAITPQACLDFTRGVYTSLLDGVPLEVAVTAGRQAMTMRDSGNREWGMPLLYLQVSDGTFLVRRSDDVGVEEVLTTIDAGEPVAEPPSDPERYREWRKLKLRREIYERNLKELKAQVDTSLGKPSPFVESQIKDTEDRLKKIDEQLRALGELEVR